MFEFDPFDPAYFADPWRYYKAMRDEHPVYRREIPDHRVWPHYWMLSRAADVDEALADWRTYSSAQGTLIDTDISLLPPNMFNMDPPRHDELRSILARVLTPRRIENLEPVVRAYARELVEELRPTGSFDVSTRFAQLVPTITMCTLMDLPREDRAKFLKWNLDTLAGADFTSPEALAAYGEMATYWTGVVAVRRESPGNDLISQIIHTEVDGDPLSDEEIGGFCSLLHDAAQNTTMNMLTHSVLTLGRHPEQRARLAAEPALWPRAVDELMRYVSPVQGLARCTTRDVELHGVTIPKGDQVLLLYGAANHDERVWPEPETFDIGRAPRANYGFGHGIHHCLGNAVAKLEIRCAMDELVRALGDWHVDEASIELNQLVPTRGVAHARVEC
jgi:cytochrome P450